MPSSVADGPSQAASADLSEDALALLDSLPFAAFLLHDGILIRTNRAFTALTGRSDEAVVGRGLDALVNTSGDHESALNGAGTADLLCNREDGSTFWATIKLAPISGSAALVGQMIDITRQVDAEGALVLSQQREALGLLTNSVAHEFNNFLQILIGYIDGLKRRLADRPEPFVQRAVTRSTEAAERAAVLTRHLLTYSRRIAPDVRPVDLDRFLDAIAPSLRAALPPRLSLVIGATEGLRPAMCNPTQVELALRHILANAAEATTEGGTVTIATFALNAGESTLQRPADGAVGIAITDHGDGMSPEMLSRALAPFATSREAGRGVGLAIVHGLMKRQNGTISFESRIGEGTTVRLIFPTLP